MAHSHSQPFPQEATAPAQEKTFLAFDLMPARNGDLPFVVMTVTGPENALCVRLNAPTVGDIIRQLEQMRTAMRTKRQPNLIATGRFIISEGTRLPGWWKTKSYEEMLRDWRHTTLRESVRDDMAKGEAVPPEVLAYFPDL